MNTSGSWLLSGVIHAALIIGASIPVLASTRAIDYSGGGFDCSVRDTTWHVDRIERPADVFTHQLPEVEPAPPEEDPIAGFMDPGRDRNCGPCAEELIPGIQCKVCTLRAAVLRIRATGLAGCGTEVANAPPCTCGRCGTIADVLGLLHQ